MRSITHWLRICMLAATEEDLTFFWCGVLHGTKASTLVATVTKGLALAAAALTPKI